MKTYPDDIKTSVGLAYKKWMDIAKLEDRKPGENNSSFWTVVKEDAKQMLQISKEIGEEYDSK